MPVQGVHAALKESRIKRKLYSWYPSLQTDSIARARSACQSKKVLG